MIAGRLRQRKSDGLRTSTCSKRYSSVARLKKMSCDSVSSMSTADDDGGARNSGHAPSERAASERAPRRGRAASSERASERRDADASMRTQGLSVWIRADEF